MITVGWGVAVAMAVYAVGPNQRRASEPGGHRRPGGNRQLLVGRGARLHRRADVGGFLGAILVWLMYLPHWAVTPDPGAKLAVFATGPAIRNTAANFIGE